MNCVTCQIRTDFILSTSSFLLFNFPSGILPEGFNYFVMAIIFLSIACVALSASCILLSRRVSRLEKDFYCVYHFNPNKF